MVLKKWLLISAFLCGFCAAWINERPILETVNGNLYITGAEDRNISLKTIGVGFVNLNDVNLLETLLEAKQAAKVIEKWKTGILDDVETTLHRLTNIVEGPHGLLRKLNLLEVSESVSNSSNFRPSIDNENNPPSASIGQVRAVVNRLRRLESKVRTISAKLRNNECLSDPCQNGGTCIDLYDSFQCHCPPEWEGTFCAVDVNECETLGGKPGGCQNGATCVNLPGTFSCNCANGWHGFHCSTQKSACDQSNEVELCGNGVCVKNNSPLGYTCICKTGWDHLSESDPSCRKDVDECTTYRYPCSLNPVVTCHNVPGTFYCGTCPPGYTGDGFKCQDIDECLTNNGGCSTTPFVECINTLGSRKCSSCPSGYQGDGITCFYVGSCSVSNGGCHAMATCREGPNSQIMCQCRAGYHGDGMGPNGCVAVRNDCRSNPCEHGTCSPLGQNGFVCTCNEGYTGPTCSVVVNQCEPNPCQNHGVCRISTKGRRFCECTATWTGPTCSDPKSACGGFYKTEVGNIEFPAGGNKYDHGLSCAWVILTNQTMVLNVTFTRFALEEARGGDECKHDYLQIHDGRSAGSNIFGRYCGNALPNNGTIISTHNSLYIWFHSDSTVNSDGFAFRWESIEPVCGGEIYEDFGSIASPGFPIKYPTNRDCYWNIYATPGKRLVLNFISFMLEEHETCGYDYVEVNETNYAGPYQLGLFCNHSKPMPITTSGDQVSIHFHSDSAGTASGFHLSFLTIPGAPNCGGVYTAESGEISSPGTHSGSYQSNLECDWEIRITGSRIRITWLKFDIESSRNCIFDSVQIYEGPTTNAPLLGKYCGSALPPTLSINTNRALIRLETDPNIEEGGFVLKYEVECGGVFTEPSGILKSPYYPNAYPASKDCVYLISQPIGKAIVLTFEFMDIEEGTTIYNETECYFDRLEIRDGDSENSTLLMTLCGSEHEMPVDPIISTHNYLYLQFTTDASLHNLGFKANYTTIDRNCGGIIKDAPGTLSMPGLPQNSWNYDVDCLWTIHAPVNHAIQLSWLSHPVRSSNVVDECKRNYLEIMEHYGSDDEVSLGKYCPYKAPPQIMTTQGNDVTLHYKFSGDTSDIIYEASFVFINDTHNCGGHYFAESGSIKSPKYPEKYPRNKECVWIIEAKNKYLVTLVFQKFNIEKSDSCSYDYVEIRSGSQHNSPLLGRFCGKEEDKQVVSLTNQMYIKFVSDSSLQGEGFDMYWHSSKSGCGGNLQSSSGSITSPNYPQNYYHRAVCTWNIRVAAGSAIRITFIDFELENQARCVFDYLEIADMINGYTHNPQKFCGSVIPPIFISKNNQVRLTFRSDLLTSSRGFHLRYQTECNNSVTGFHGVIESPNFPDEYENYSNCSWKISVPAGNKINITFSHFSVMSNDAKNCTEDYVKIQEGDNDEPNTRLIQQCGGEEVLPLKVASTQRQVFITFVTDEMFTSTGFRLEWYVNGCSQRLTKPYGHFTSPGYPHTDQLSDSYVECEWLIEVGSDNSIEITFPQIENTRSQTCVYDTIGSITIYNGRNDAAPQIAHELCYSKTPVTFTSTGNTMLIKYSSEKNSAGHGFSALYKSVDIKCGGRFTGQSGAIHSANYPKNYPHNQNCEWLITVDEYHTMNLTFLELDLERSRNCSDDYIKIFDGNSTDAPVLGVHCQSAEPIYYISTGNQLLVTMRTDPLVSAKGFKAVYNRTCGARIIIDEEGMIQSSPTLHTMSEVNCSWILVARDPSDKVTLTFNHIDLLEHSECDSNHVDIYEGEGTTGPLLGQICNNAIPTPFTSSGNILTVHLVTDYGPTVGDKFDATYSTFSNACGGKYTSEKGTIASPNYPLSYPSQTDCIWIIKNSPGSRVGLTFDEFELNESEFCDTDYVEVREKDGIGKLRGTFCGKTVQSVTSTEPLWIRFKSSAASTGNPKGFKARYVLFFGDEITGDSGEITSPMYPKPYRRSETIMWRITVDFNYVIKLEFEDFNFDNYEDYCYSSLKIYDGYNDEAPQLKELCGLSNPKDTITSSGNMLYIEMENNYDTVGSWFRLNWVKVPRSSVSEVNVDEQTSKNSELITLTDSNGTYNFHSPGFPDGYENSLTYTWTFVSPVGTHVLLRFLTMNLEESEGCVADYVAIYNGYNTEAENLLNKTCLSNAILSTYTGGNVMTVQFVTDVYVNQTGFSAIVMQACGGLIEQSSGVIQLNSSAYSQRTHPYIYSCEWIVKVRVGRRINVRVTEHSIDNKIHQNDQNNSCVTNYLMLKNGGSASSPLLGTGKYCNSALPPVQNTSSNYLYVKLSVAYASVNFFLSFKELGHDCGGNIILSNYKMDSQILISSPNYPNIPPPHTECFWTLISKDETRLTIHFMERFDFAYSDSCDREYIEIKDGGTDESPSLGRYCKNPPPSSITTSGNVMYVRYFTDLAEPRNGFKALITNDVCGGIEREARGSYINSPNYPEDYDTRSQYCSWWIIAPYNSRTIRLQFEELELPMQRNCTGTDHITVFEKIPGIFTSKDDYDSNVTEVGTYCGRSNPGPIDVLTSEALIVFHSSFSQSNGRSVFAKRFRLNYTFSIAGCGGQMSGMEGEFQTVGYPRPSIYRYCKWKITVPEGYQVVLNVENLDVSNNNYSRRGYVVFHNDPIYTAPITTIRDSKSRTIVSSSNIMSITYLSNGDLQGMKASYIARAPAPCGGILNSWQGTVTSPQSAPFNQSQFYCRWVVRQPKDDEYNSDRKGLTLALKVSGIINSGGPSLTCRNYLTNVVVKGEGLIAAMCGDMSKEPLVVTSPFKSHTIEAMNGTNSGTTVNFVIDYEWHKCGGILTGPSDTIRPPKNATYPMYCAWKVKYLDVDNDIQISFKKMNLGSCENGYLLIKGRTYHSPTIGKYCGNEVPQNSITHPSNVLTVEFYAKDSSADFEISFDSGSSACGGNVRARKSEIRSPGFPANYPQNTECIWDIEANNGYHVGLSFVERFNLETSTNCQNDYVEIFEWKAEPETGVSEYHSMGKVCGRNAPEKPFNSTTNRMRVKFVTNDNIEGEGFKIVWSQNCGGVFEVSKTPKYIDSPTNRYSYPANSYCNYTLVAPDEQDIIVEFTSFYLEGSLECAYDNLTMSSYNGEWMQWKNTWCGMDSPGRKVARGKMEIIFRSDSSINREGFKFKYFLNDCGGTITKPRVIAPLIEEDPEQYAYMDCQWVVTAPPKKSVLVRFEKFSLDQPLGGCITNYVRLYEGNSTEKKNQKATFCGDLDNSLPVVQSINNTMTIIFRYSSYGNTNSSIKAAILFVKGPEEGCGGNINLTNFLDFRTQTGEFYEPFQDCHWLVNVPQGWVIDFTITKIDLKNTTFNDTIVNKKMACNSDYLEIRNGGPYAEVLGRICGSGFYPGLTTTSNLMWIRFVSDGLNEGRGVEGTLKAVLSSCGPTDLYVTNTSQILTSPGYPDKRYIDISCRWIIHAGPGRYKRLRIVFDDFVLEDGEKCEWGDYLQISDLDNREIISEGFGEGFTIEGGNKGGAMHSTVIASRSPQHAYKYCGSYLPHDYYSDYKDVEVVYKAKEQSGKKKGFKLEYSKASCTRNYTSLQGRISHDEVVDCRVMIETDPGTTINMYFNHFFLPGSADCSKAKMEIRDGGFDGHVIQTVCGFEIPNPVFSTKNVVSFHAIGNKDRDYMGTAYDITYTSTTQGRGCGGAFYNYGGVFTSPMYPAPYRNRTTCVYDVVVPKNLKVTLSFTVFDIGVKSICETDYLTISDVTDDPGTVEPTITYCGGDKPADFTGQGYRARVTYSTSINNGGTGWVAHFAAKG